eukprot:TRINITY_DN3607_c0_g1_i1.p1 TRINITY_DN3607_c0_g1~~TRINITY_DN3607_c0_g1_i1.p1  ORF type:complete len:185 (+),score=50.26 TRINITY_DN3607_c0_g1_i1:397-951(+)
MEKSYYWIPSFNEDFTFLQESPKRLQGMRSLRKKLSQMLDNLIKLGWMPQHIFLLGFSQGASIALDLGLHYTHRLGGIIAISGGLLDEYIKSGEEFSDTGKTSSILVTHGTRDDRIPLTSARTNFESLKDRMTKPDQVQFVEFSKGHQMISSQPEMKQILEFLSTKLRLRDITLESRSDVFEVK